MRKIINSFAKTLPLVGLMALTVDANAQEGCLTNGASGTIQNLSTGTISFVEDDSYLDNDNAAGITNEGTIEFSAATHALGGTNAIGTAALPIPGTVDWNGTAAQDILERYYTNLTVSEAGAKNFEAGSTTYISGDYTNNTGSTTRNYDATSTIVYNSADGVNPQTISADTYANLEFQELGAKELAAGETATVNGTTTFAASNTGTVTVDGTFAANETVTQDAAAGAIVVNDAGTFTLGDAAAQHDLNGDVNLTNGGTFAVNSPTNGADFAGDITNTEGTFDVDAGTATVSGTLGLADDAAAIVDVADGSTLDMLGTFTNARDERDNMTFGATSTVAYTSAIAQDVVSTSDGNPYGNLTLSGSDKTNVVGDGTESDVNIAGDFSLAGGSFTVDGDNANDGTDARSLVMQDNTKSVTYAADGEEVVGGFKWVAGAGGFSIGTDYTLNNADAKFNFPVGANTGTPAATDYLELRSYPSAQPRGFDGTVDVDRLYQLWYSYTTWEDVSLQLSWTEAQEGAWAGDNTREETVRFWESDGATAADIEKVSTGAANAYTRTQGTGVGSDYNIAELKGIDPGALPIPDANNVDGTADGEFGHTNDFVLRSGPTTFYTINHGRWSNPATWDEGVEPSSLDQAVVQHTVHAGYTRANDNYATQEATPADLATSITVDAGAGTNASLLFGNDGAGSDIFGVTGDEGTIEIINIVNANVIAVPNADLENNDNNGTGSGISNATEYNGGVYVFANSSINVTGCFTINNGDVKNAGTIELGNQ